MERVAERIRREGLLKAGFRDAPLEDVASPPHVQVLRLCDRGALDGGLSVALDVRPDEAFGGLCAAIGGDARRLRVVDVRERPFAEIRVRYGEIEEGWEIEDLPALVHNLNVLLEADPGARAVAVLGEWDDALQLWCVPKDKLGTLLRADYFAPWNRQQLVSLAERRS
jgi:hypothetical protein